MVERLLHLTASAAAKQKRLAALLGGRDPSDAALWAAVADAQLLGSLELADVAVTWEQVQASRRGEPAPAAIDGLRAAQQAVGPQAPFSVRTLLAWHAAVTGGAAGLRTAERTREAGPPPAPAAFVAGRLKILEDWLGVESSRELKPAQAGALVLARLLEILPFDEANGRVSRLAASHLMVRAGGRPPILVGADAPRLAQAVEAAFQLATEPLATLLDEASERVLDVMIQTLEPKR
jgi:hypothetical protein